MPLTSRQKQGPGFRGPVCMTGKVCYHLCMILSLFDYTGVWSAPYRTAGYDVLQVDIQHGSDVFDPALDQLVHVEGILAAPPCTEFAVSGARWFEAKDRDGRTAEACRLVRRTLDLIKLHQPEWWGLENPVSRINTLFPELGKARFTYDPCDYGLPWTKRTQVWGRFTVPDKGPVVKAEGNRAGQPNAWYSSVGGSSLATKNFRSACVPGFADAWFVANP